MNLFLARFGPAHLSAARSYVHAPLGQPSPLGRIGVISDTHGLLRPEALEALEGVDRILHAGDIGNPDHLGALARIAPVMAIRGNIDRGDWAEALPDTATVTIEGLRIHMIHDRNALKADPQAEGWDVVISGHSHKPGIEDTGGTLWLNPGAAGPRRFRLPITLAFLWAEAGRPRAMIHPLPV
ncbi:metallophosphoesterase family protein [Palleronia marisminoris]|uniref:metallophosphoesterase family protein n=1 Tax=Palleronia marisminoris TaxID=315423 RepID=UPI001FE20879|nr:metallophosphoesterase family protein [Palleronia marisminoris]